MPETGNQLLDGEQLKGLLEKAIKNSESKLVVISAYITQVAVDWLAKHVPQDIDVIMVCRLQPFDVINGSTHIPALIKAIDKGWSVSCLHSLHAKIYAVDDALIYAGSANLTSNGLKIYGIGNLEASVQISPSKQNLTFIEKVCQSSTQMNKNILQKMQSYAEGKKADITSFQWPSDILDEREGIWSQDFFWTKPNTGDDEDEKLHDLEILCMPSFECDDAILKEKVLEARCVQWLIDTLKNEDDQELYFGHLTKALHDDLKDDPAPYRKDVKALIQNMLSYCEEYLGDYIEISRPNYSQKVKLLVT
ncbi:MAG: hypothetical protein COA81_13085 [Alphaproteobacteria bacterium]|nr:MAG: hypothetical protein COA81_13085 [Alphaproteobacteria bacterium]